MSLKIEGLSKKFGDHEVIASLQLEIPSGSFTALVGPSGCGKSTLLRLMAGLEKPSSGSLKYDTNENDHIGFVFQESQLLPWRSVAENILLPLELQNSSLSESEKHGRVQTVLKKVKLEHAGRMYPHELSGGMKMRVSVARALISNPSWLFMDEPFGALDEPTRFEMQDLIKQLWMQENLSVVFVTHSLFEAAFLSERIIMFGPKLGKITADQTLKITSTMGEDLRTSQELNNLVKDLSQRIRA
ncbi:Aliphatic sulfonates import ATP-binding protein SsuB [compost metagenome]